jgi:signal transduction histidine kinase
MSTSVAATILLIRFSDILTLSKLDAKLLTIAPIMVRYVDSITQCTKMFHSAAQAQGIELVLESHESLKALGVEWVQIDASRVNQVIINLLTK